MAWAFRCVGMSSADSAMLMFVLSRLSYPKKKPQAMIARMTTRQMMRVMETESERARSGDMGDSISTFLWKTI